MIQSFKHIAVIFVIAVVSLIVFKLFLKHEQYNYPQRIVLPPEQYSKIFEPTKVVDEKVSSNPFSNNESEHLPKGVSKKDVKQSLEIELDTKAIKLLGDSTGATIKAVQLNNGEIWVGKNLLIKSVTVTRFEPATFSFRLKPGLGIGVSYQSERLRLSPMASLSFAEWNIGTLNILGPTSTIDFDGIGVGTQVHIGSLQLFGVESGIYIGASRVWCLWGSEGITTKVTAGLTF